MVIVFLVLTFPVVFILIATFIDVTGVAVFPRLSRAADVFVVAASCA